MKMYFCIRFAKNMSLPAYNRLHKIMSVLDDSQAITKNTELYCTLMHEQQSKVKVMLALSIITNDFCRRS